MSLKHDLKNIVVNEEVSGPFISLFLPLYPSKDNFKFDDTEFNSLLSKAKKQFIAKYGEKNWSKYEKKIKATQNDIIFDYAQSKSLAIIISNETAYHYYLPRKVDLHVRVADKPYILPIIRGYEYMPSYNIAKITRSSFEMFTVKNGLVSQMNLSDDAPVSAEQALNIDTPDQKIRMEQRGGGSYDQFRGTDVKAEAEQANMDQYFRMVDEYITKHISLKNHLKVVLMATEDDAGEFKKLSHNHFLDKEDTLTIPAVINHETLEKATAKITKRFIDESREKIEDAIDLAHSKKRYLEGMKDVQAAAEEGRLDTTVIAHELAVNETETDEQVQANEIAIDTLVYGGQVNLVDPAVINDQSIVGILRGI